MTLYSAEGALKFLHIIYIFIPTVLIILIAFGSFYIVFNVAKKRKEKNKKNLLLVICSVISIIAIILIFNFAPGIKRFRTIYDRYKSGKYNVVEGYVSGFNKYSDYNEYTNEEYFILDDHGFTVFTGDNSLYWYSPKKPGKGVIYENDQYVGIKYITYDNKKYNKSGYQYIVEIYVPEPLKEYNFSSEEDFYKLSEEDVIYLATHNYRTIDFVNDFNEDSYDFFGTPLRHTENVFPGYLELEGKNSDFDVNQKISDEDYKRLAEEYLDYFKECGKEIIFYGETEHYSEYGIKFSADFQERRCFNRNRFCFSKTDGIYYFGELTVENVMSEEDFDYSNYFYEYLLLREVEDREDAIVYVAYYPKLKDIGDYGEYDENQKAEIYKSVTFYDKKTHKITGNITLIRTVDIPGTKLYIPEPV
ncbi:MAG: hypothetical protein IKS56_05690 [Lachnospiraceae bacterium]|nr:hypothetical protein [Lachnospiraceae bacterium]